MESVLTMPKSLDDAVNNAFIAIEKGNFNKVINLLEYVTKQKKDYDQEMVNYALLISYMNTGQIEMASLILVRMEKMNIKNPQIAEVVKAVKGDIQKTIDDFSSQNVELKNYTYEEIMKNLSINDRLKEVNHLYEMFGEATVWEYLLSPDYIAELNVIYRNYILKRKNFETMFLNFKNFNDDFTPLNMFEAIKKVEEDYFFWFNFKKSDVTNILNNKMMPKFVKNYLMERLAYLGQEKIIKPITIELKEISDQISTIELPVYKAEVDMVAKEVMMFYPEKEEIDIHILEQMIESVASVIMIDNYPLNFYEEIVNIKEVIAYIVNDIFLGREYDDMIAKKAQIEFKQVKKEIQKYQMLIKFLIT